MLIYLCFACVVAARADNNMLPLFLYELNDRLRQQEDKEYNNFLNILLTKTSLSVKREYMPIRRTTRRFLANPKSCAFPANLNAILRAGENLTSHDFIISHPIDYVSIFVYSRASDPLLKHMGQLRGLNIGHVNGSVGAAILKKSGAKFHAAPSDDHLLKMLQTNRIEAIVGFHPDIAIAFDRLGYDQLRYSKDLRLLKAETSFVCHDTPKTRRFLSQINPYIKKLYREGVSSKIFSEHAELVEY